MNDQACVIDLKPVSHPYQWFSNMWSTGFISDLYYKLERKIILPHIFNNLQNLCGMIVKSVSQTHLWAVPKRLSLILLRQIKFLLNLSFIIIIARKIKVFVLNVFWGFKHVCIYSNFKCYKLNPSILQVQMILGHGFTEILRLFMGLTVPDNLRTPHFYHHKLMSPLLSVILW